MNQYGRDMLAVELLGGFVTVLALLLLAGMVCQAIGSARDARRYRAPGRLVDVGGHRLHIHCQGEGRPAVVMDAGFPGTSLSWSLVQPEIAKFTRACAYDRAGLGWSDPGPIPRTSRQIVEELRALLIQAGVEGPYVLVGHSFGAFTARLYASTYPNEVAGIVLVDPLHPGEWLDITEEQKRRLEGAVRLSRYAALLARLGIARLISSLVSAGAVGMARFGVSLVTAGALKGAARMAAPVAKLPAGLRPIIGWLWSQPKFFEALAGQIEALPESAAQVQVAATADYGELPLIVLSAGNSDPHRKMEQESVARLSSNSKHLVALNSGHWIQLDEPQLVIDAIRELVEAARHQSN